MKKLGYLIGNFLVLVLMVGGVNAMADYPTFTCAYEKDHNPPPDAEAERWSGLNLRIKQC